MGLWSKVLVATIVTVTLLAGCTSSGSGPGDKSKSGTGGAKAPPAVGGVLVEQTIDAPTSGTNYSPGGTLKVTVRSVTVSEGRTVVVWAMGWDDPKTTDGKSVDVEDFFDPSQPPVLTDGKAMKYYYPLCDNDWHKSASGCIGNALFSPRWLTDMKLVNHHTTEAWAIFPEVGKDTTTVDLALPEGLPAFSALPVTRS